MNKIGRFVFSAKKAYIATILLVVLQPLALFAVPAQPTNLEISGSPAQPTLSWGAASDGPTGQSWSQLLVNDAGAINRFRPRDGFGTVAFDGKLWVAGGFGGSQKYNDVWYTSDGVNWTEATANAAWARREALTMVTYDNKMWILGGRGVINNNLYNDVWYTSDGVNWTQATTSAAWSPRYNHEATVFNDKLWVAGGNGGSVVGTLNDVWYTSDGVNWTQATASAAWSRREVFEMLSYRGNIWAIGGYDDINNQMLNDVWYTSDGVNWTQATNHAAWVGREALTVNEFAGEMWVIGGDDYNNGDPQASIWKSKDGINWYEVTTNPEMPGRTFHEAVVYKDHLYALGGYITINWLLANDVWSTPDLSVSHYKLCWDTVQGGCRNTAVSTSTSYALNQPLSPGTWYFSVIAVNGQGEESVLGASTELTVPTVALYPLSGKGQTYRLDDTIYATDSTASAPVEDSVTTPEVISPTNDEKDSTDDEQDGSTLPLALAIIAVILATGWLIFRYSLKRRG